MTPHVWSFASGGGWWSGLLLEATLKGTLCLAVAALAALALRRRSAAQRHLAWTAGIVAVLFLPLLLVALPDWPIPVGREWVPRSLASAGLVHIDGRPGAAPPRATPASSLGAADVASVIPLPPGELSVSRPLDGESWPLELTLSLVWLAGAVAVFLPLLVASRRLARIARRGAPLDGDRWRALCEELAPGQGLDAESLRLIRAGEPVGPLTWGIFRPVVMLPPGCDGWSDAQARTVLVHELCHRLAARQMLTERERACDDQVLLSGARASDYADDLLELARSLGAPWATSRVTTASAAGTASPRSWPAPPACSTGSTRSCGSRRDRC